MNISAYLSKALYQLTTLNRGKYAKTYPVTENIKSFEDISYVSNNNKLQTLDIYTPNQNNRLLPVIIHIHGGGWTVGDKKDVTYYCKFLASKGYVAVAINYPLAPKCKHPQQEKEVLKAIQWVSKNIEQYYGNNQYIILSGDSGGAHLASFVANVCTNETYAQLYDVIPPLKKEQIDSMILFYGAYDFNTLIDTTFPLAKTTYKSFIGTMDIKNNQAMINKASPILHINNNFPDTLLISGEVDLLHQSQSVEFEKKLKSLNINYKTVFFDDTKKDAIHGFLVDYSRPSTIESLNQILLFLNRDN